MSALATALLVIAALIFTALCFLAWVLCHLAPEGHEDDLGFDYGRRGDE